MSEKHIHALHAAISRRDWHATEVAANALRDDNSYASYQAEIERLRTAMRHILPYLNWTIGEESPAGHHPTMPSAVAAFRAALEPKP